MQESVEGEWHIPVRDLVGNLGEQPLAAQCGVLAPPGKVQTLPALKYVAFHEPGNRRDIAVPGIMRGVGMAILARSGDGSEHLRSDLGAGQEGSIGSFGSVGARGDRSDNDGRQQSK